MLVGLGLAACQQFTIGDLLGGGEDGPAGGGGDAGRCDADDVVEAPDDVVVVDAPLGFPGPFAGPLRVHDGTVSGALLGDLPDCVLARFRADGSRDLWFGVDGVVEDLAYCTSHDAIWLPDGSSWFEHADHVERRNPDGILDGSFGVGGRSKVLSVTQWLVGMDAEALPIISDADDDLVQRMAMDGQGDPTFAEIRSKDVRGALPLADGRLMLLGEDEGTVYSATGFPDAVVALATLAPVAAAPDGGVYTLDEDGAPLRYDADGVAVGEPRSLTFERGSVPRGTALVVDPWGRVWVAGELLDVSTALTEPAVWRLDEDLAPDPCFGTDGRISLAEMPDAGVMGVGEDGTVVVGNAWGAEPTVAWFDP